MDLLSPVTNDPAFKWNEKAARHLLNRAGFGVPVSLAKKLAALGPAEAVDYFVQYERRAEKCAPPPDNLPDRKTYAMAKKETEGLTEPEIRRRRQEFRKQEKEAMLGLQAWWIDCMGRSERPLQEKMALFWHGHFATSAEKVQAPRDNLDLNQIFRAKGLGNFPELVLAVGQSPAMMRYLDQNRSNRKKPNENWARELMELFTLGIGQYSEADIKEAARAFTGWVLAGGADFRFARRQHDDGEKTILGQRGRFDGEDVVRIVTEHPACAPFICGKLWRFFAYDDPEPTVIEGLARTFRASGMDVRPVLRQMFLSRAFYQEKAYFSVVKPPAQLVVGLLDQLAVDDGDGLDRLGAFAMRAMGQSLFYPPNVKGWDGGRAWINTNTLMVRYNFSSFLVSGVVPDLKGLPGGGAARREFMMALVGRNDGPEPGRGRRTDDDAPEAPAGQDAMPNDIPAQTFYRRLREQKEARAARRRPGRDRKASGKERAAASAPFDARQFFAQYQGKNADEIVDALTRYFLGFDLDTHQREKLKAALAQGVAPGAAVPVTRMAEEDLRATVQLLLSTVEYQVC